MPDALADLRALARTFPSALLGYSGGVDSALLAVVMRQELGRDRMVAAIGRSASYPEAQWRTARDVADRFDVPVVEVDTHELEDPQYLANPANRCFYCKTELWSRLVPLARERGLAVICDGTNADDLSEGEHRPGRAAGAKAGPRRVPGPGSADVGRAGRSLPFEPRAIRSADHAGAPRTGGVCRGVSARAGRARRLARTPSRRRGAH